MKPKVVVPENVTDAPVWSLVSIMAELAGAWMLSRVIEVHAATAGEICDHSVQRHGVAVIVEYEEADFCERTIWFSDQ